MLTPCPVLMVYNHSRMLFVTFMREPLARSRYRHRFIVMIVHCLRVLPLIGFHTRCRHCVLPRQAPLRSTTGSRLLRIRDCDQHHRSSDDVGEIPPGFHTDARPDETVDVLLLSGSCEIVPSLAAGLVWPLFRM